MSFIRSISSPSSSSTNLPPIDLRARSLSAPAPLTEETEVTPAFGQILRSDYIYKGMVYGSQTIERISTIPAMVRQLEIRRDYLLGYEPGTLNEEEQVQTELSDIRKLLDSCYAALEGDSHIPREIAEKISNLKSNLAETIRTNDRLQTTALNRSIAIQNENLAHYREQCKFDWIGSNYVRDCLVDCRDLEDPSLPIAYTAYLQACEEIIPAAVNLRRHEIIAGDRKATIIRTGVISDMRDGYHSLDTLVEAQKPGTTLRRKLFRAADAHRKELYDKTQQSTPELVVLHNACENIKTDAALNASVARRRSYMQHQMLMLVMEHVKTAQQDEAFDRMHTLPILHLSLLNRKTDVTDKTGWKKSEEIFMRDMAQIFKEFDGKAIVFDGRGPLVDARGIIHMPPEYGDSGREMTLDTNFINISVQNHKKNDGQQKVINRAFFKKLYETGHRDLAFEELTKKLKKSSDFDTAEAFANAALKHGYYLSIGCLSAKDRTGWLCGRVGVHHVIENSCQLLTSSERKLREETWCNDIFDGPAFGVCEDCNLRALEPLNVEALKLTELKLAGVSAAKRASQFSRLASMVIAPKSPQLMRRKVSPPESKRRGVDTQFIPFSNVDGNLELSEPALVMEEESFEELAPVVSAPSRRAAQPTPSFIREDLKLDKHPRGRTFTRMPKGAGQVSALTKWFEELAEANRPR